ncbi:TetR/AcrR family transcriptional regulator [Paenibacillus sp. BSR1-1]|uniref:TetR/AcrR family transcriptional regulator n=1 Tax=Paenibacillus sp. BSR1-1 TaxID=3020845 RepID=UPI0025AFE66D|nr:TetR/AcrR family transcriptional regulator [Paenibacillus sp. BSR1-1]MDN3017588.1 TetR/AcrR family transcriptional regulator [Paenibacillus sp. BSR1-1]
MLFVEEMPKEAKDKILYAGLSLFTSSGFKNTSVLDIVEMARVSKTTFYQHFTSKENLMAGLFEVLFSEIISEVKQASEQENRYAYKAYFGIRRYIEICFSDVKVAGLMLVESVGVSQEVEKVRSDAHRRFAQLIFTTVQGLLPSTVSEIEMQLVSQAMVGAINEVVVQNYNVDGGTRVSYDDLARLLNRIVISAFVNLAN